MLANFLDKSKPINFIVLMVLFFLFFLIRITKSDSYVFDFNGILVMLLNSIIFLFIFFFFNFVDQKNKLTLDNTYAFFCFVILLMLFFDFTKPLFPLLFLIQLLFFRKIYSLKSYKNRIQKLFDAGFWLAILAILQPQFLLFFILLYVSVSIFYAFNWQTILSPLVGFFSVIILDYCYFLYVNNTSFYLEKFQFNVQFYSLRNQIDVFLVYGFFVFVFFASIFKSLEVLPFNTSYRKKWTLMHFHFLVGLFASLITEHYGLFLLIFPASLIFASALESLQNKWVKHSIVYLLTIICLSVFFTI